MILSDTLGSTQCSPLGCSHDLIYTASSCTKLNPQLLCCLDVNLKDLNPKGVHMVRLRAKA